MLWTTLTSKIAFHVWKKPFHPGSKELLLQAHDAGQELTAYLRSIDIRNVGKLRELVPDAFPRKLRKGMLVCDRNIHGKWRVQVQQNKAESDSLR